MPRICFQLHVRPELIWEYTARHREVWPEMTSALTETGWRNYSLFLAPDGTLTGYLECDDFDAALAGMAERDVNARWQAEMAEVVSRPLAWAVGAVAVVALVISYQTWGELVDGLDPLAAADMASNPLDF